MYLKKITTILITLFFLGSESFARSMDDDESYEFAGFIYSLIETAQGMNKGTICVLGNDEIVKVLSVKVKNLINLSSNLVQYSSCKAIYVARSEERLVRSEINKFNSKKILTLAVFDGFVESGGMVQVQMGRRNFELILNSKTSKESGIKLGALGMGLVIN